ncbi:MAG: UDP-glucose/GDP-mannose dehydrogenase family protein [Candidatus Micrarchaeota archaeon]
MKLSFIGAGYVGLVSAAGYSRLGNESACIDLDANKVKQINRGIPPIYEEGLEALLKKLVAEKKLGATQEYSGASDSEVIFICVGTPSRKDGSADLGYVQACAKQIGKELKNTKKFVAVVVKSTVVPGTTADIVLPILEKESGKVAGKDFGIAMMPEFLKEGTALEDFSNPDRIIIGCEDRKTLEILRKLHSNFKCPILEVPIPAAEMIKYASNSFLATKISFINFLANLCEKTGVDIDEVARGMGLDSRIGKHFLKAGPGFGGSCFPKDVKALMAFSEEKGIESLILEAVLEINYLQPMRMIELASEEIELKGKKVAVLGLAFKPDTDDVRESPAIPVVKELERIGCKIFAYDPKASENFRKLFPKISYAASMAAALKETEACFIVTDWEEFKKPLGYYESLMKYPLIIDSRRILDLNGRKKAIYKAIGKKA